MEQFSASIKQFSCTLRKAPGSLKFSTLCALKRFPEEWVQNLPAQYVNTTVALLIMQSKVVMPQGVLQLVASRQLAQSVQNQLFSSY